MRSAASVLPVLIVFWSVSAGAADTAAPPTPTVSGVDFVSCTRVRVRWTNVVDTGVAPDPASGVAYYTVYRRTAKVVTLLGHTSGGELPHIWSSRRDSFDAPAGTHQFGVSATDKAGNTSATAWSSGFDLPGSMAALCGDTKKPNAPAAVTASLNARSCVEATVEWGAAVDLPSKLPFIPASGVKSYRVYRDGRLLLEVPATSPRTTDDRFGLAPGRWYRYTVTAVDQVGNESLPGLHFDLYTPEECSARTRTGDIAVTVYGVRFADRPEPAYAVSDLAPYIGDATAPGILRSYFSETSYGRATFHAAASTGWWVLPHDRAYYCPADCDANKIETDTLIVSGISGGPDDVRLIFVKDGSTAKTGLSTVVLAAPATLPLSSADVGVLAHEFSHLFRAEHSAIWNCPSGLPGPDITDMTFGCGDPYFGDPYSPLSYSIPLRHHPAYTKRVMGFLPADTTRTVIADGIYEIGALEDAAENFKDLRLSVLNPSDPKFFKPPFYAIEYRTPTGYDGAAGSGYAPFEGLIVRAVPDVIQGATANTFYVKKILLAPGENVFYDPTNDLGVRLLSMDGKVATVRVCGIGTTPCPPDFFD